MLSGHRDSGRQAGGGADAIARHAIEAAPRAERGPHAHLGQT